MADEPRQERQQWEEVVREAARRLSPPETVVFVPPQPVWQHFRLTEGAPPPCVEWQPSRRPEYKWTASEGK